MSPLAHVITIPEVATLAAYSDADGAVCLAVEIMALEAMGASGVNIGAPAFRVVPYFEEEPNP